jgi:hypothetical protein
MAAMLVVDPWHWLTADGHFLVDNPHLYRRMLRIARFIEYGGELQKNETRETLIECKRRPKGKTTTAFSRTASFARPTRRLSTTGRRPNGPME